MIELKESGGAVYLPVKVVPGASRTRCLGPAGGRLRVAVAAPPEKGKANAALTAHLARLLGLRRRQLTVEQGHTSPAKIVRIEGTTADHVRSVLGLTSESSHDADNTARPDSPA